VRGGRRPCDQHRGQSEYKSAIVAHLSSSPAETTRSASRCSDRAGAKSPLSQGDTTRRLRGVLDVAKRVREFAKAAYPLQPAQIDRAASDNAAENPNQT